MHSNEFSIYKILNESKKRKWKTSLLILQDTKLALQSSLYYYTRWDIISNTNNNLKDKKNTMYEVNTVNNLKIIYKLKLQIMLLYLIKLNLFIKLYSK